MSLASVPIAHLQSCSPVYVALYRGLRNASSLRQQLLSGNQDFEYAFLDASMILSTTHILAAVYRAINDYLHDRLKSKNVHSEVVFGLSPNNNIAESFRKFGISDNTTDLLVIKIPALTLSPAPVTYETVASHLAEQVQADEQLDFTDGNLDVIRDTDKIRKAYKLGDVREASKLQNVLISAIALRGS